MFSSSVKNFYSKIAALPLDALVWTVIVAFAVLFVAALILTLKKESVRSLPKKPFLHLVNAFSALILAMFLTENTLGESLFAALVFWCAGYLAYGVLCFLSRPVRAEKAIISQAAISSGPAREQKPPRTDGAPSVKNNVRLEHAVSITEKLLRKNLSKGDRQELEKLKNTLAVLQIKGTLSPAEAEILNENFNTLLKLMAKYNV